MFDFKSMSRTELRAYVLAHREDVEAWAVFSDGLKDDPNVIWVSPDLDEAGWKEMEKLIKARAEAERK